MFQSWGMMVCAAPPLFAVRVWVWPVCKVNAIHVGITHTWPHCLLERLLLLESWESSHRALTSSCLALLELEQLLAMIVQDSQLLLASSEIVLFLYIWINKPLRSWCGLHSQPFLQHSSTTIYDLHFSSLSDAWWDILCSEVLEPLWILNGWLQSLWNLILYLLHNCWWWQLNSLYLRLKTSTSLSSIRCLSKNSLRINIAILALHPSICQPCLYLVCSIRPLHMRNFTKASSNYKSPQNHRYMTHPCSGYLYSVGWVRGWWWVSGRGTGGWSRHYGQLPPTPLTSSKIRK